MIKLLCLIWIILFGLYFASRGARLHSPRPIPRPLARPRVQRRAWVAWAGSWMVRVEFCRVEYA